MSYYDPNARPRGDGTGSTEPDYQYVVSSDGGMGGLGGFSLKRAFTPPKKIRKAVSIKKFGNLVKKAAPFAAIVAPLPFVGAALAFGSRIKGVGKVASAVSGVQKVQRNVKNLKRATQPNALPPVAGEAVDQYVQAPLIDIVPSAAAQFAAPVQAAPPAVPDTSVLDYFKARDATADAAAASRRDARAAKLAATPAVPGTVPEAVQAAQAAPFGSGGGGGSSGGGGGAPVSYNNGEDTPAVTDGPPDVPGAENIASAFGGNSKMLPLVIAAGAALLLLGGSKK